MVDSCAGPCRVGRASSHEPRANPTATFTNVVAGPTDCRSAPQREEKQPVHMSADRQMLASGEIFVGKPPLAATRIGTRKSPKNRLRFGLFAFLVAVQTR